MEGNLIEKVNNSPNSSSSWIRIVFLILISLLFLDIFSGSSSSKKKKINNLKVGDKVISEGGIIGNIISIEEETVIISTGTSKIEISKSSIATKIEE